jgi:hypothetical protein
MESTSFSRLVLRLLFVLITFVAWRHYAKSRYVPSEKYLTFWPRFWAAFIDAVVLWPLTGLIPLLLSYGLPILISLPLGFIAFFSPYAYSI